MANIKHRNINAHYFSIFFHTNPLLFFVLPLTQAYIPLYGMPVDFSASRILSYSATTLPSRDICAIGKSRHTLSTIIIITFMKRLIIVLEDSKGIIIKKIKKLQKFIYKNSRNDSVAAGGQIGGVYLQRTRRHNIGTLRTFRTYIARAESAGRAVSACVPSVLWILKGARYFRGLSPCKIYSHNILIKTAFVTKK